MSKKAIFISYSWEEDEHQAWVKKFCDDLQKRLGNNYEVLLDQNLPRGFQLTRFMEIGLEESERVLVIGTPTYKKKSRDGKGVAFEHTIISSEIFNSIDTTKFYPILRKGSFVDSFPLALRGRIGDDFTDDTFYEKDLQTVVNAIINDNPIPEIFKQDSTPITADKGFDYQEGKQEKVKENHANERFKSIMANTVSHNKLNVKNEDFTTQSNPNPLTDRKTEIDDAIIGVKFSKNRKVLIRFPKNMEGKYIIPNYVTKIGNNAFKGCSNITSIVIPDSVTEIGNFAFAGCTSITFIEIPNSVTEIGEGAFSNCTSLISIKIPERVNSIKRETFSSCTSLSAIDIPESVKGIGEAAFSGCNISIIHLRNKKPIERSFYVMGIEKSKATLFVPKGSEDAYRDNMYYDRFKDIIEE